MVNHLTVKKAVRRSVVKKKEETQPSAVSPVNEPITVLDEDEDEDIPLAQLSRNDYRQKDKKNVVNKRSTNVGPSKDPVQSPVKAKVTRGFAR